MLTLRLIALMLHETLLANLVFSANSFFVGSTGFRVQPDYRFLAALVLTLVCLAFFAVSGKKVFGKTFFEYVLPIKYYLLASVLIVFSQYTIAM